MHPYPHQLKSIEETEAHLETQDRVLFQLPTGGGKTAYFSFIAKRYSDSKKKKVLVLAHRDELIDQTLKTLRTIGATAESVVASKKSLKHISSVYVGMVQTLKNRLAKDPDYLKDLGLIIADEAHLLYHDWLFPKYPNAKILGVTATPVLLKKIQFSQCARCKRQADRPEICCNIEMYEYTRDMTLSEIYEDIIIGESIQNLIDDGKLVREIVYKTGNIDRSLLKIDAKTGDFENTDEQFGNENALFDVVSNYEKLAFGKKTIIFNSSSKTNLLTYDAFVSRGYQNVRMFDSKNNNQSERAPLLKWYKETPDAILLNVSCFTTGFDEPTIECVIINRATLSLSLYFQMIGRGGRSTQLIYKPSFVVIDGGGNVDYFSGLCKNSGKWSDYVDWKSIFYGTDKKPKPKKEALENTTQCKNCGMIYARNQPVCPECEYEEPIRERKQAISNEIAKPMDDYPLPDGYKIGEYCKKNGKTMAFYYEVLINHCVDLFIFHNVSKGTYFRTLENGKFHDRLKEITTKPMRYAFVSGLEKCRHKSFEQIMKSVKSKLDNHFKITPDQAKEIRIIKSI